MFDFFAESPSFGEIWPLKDAQRFNIIKCGTAIVSKMNISALSGKKTRKTYESPNETGSSNDYQENEKESEGLKAVIKLHSNTLIDDVNNDEVNSVVSTLNLESIDENIDEVATCKPITLNVLSQDKENFPGKSPQERMNQITKDVEKGEIKPSNDNVHLDTTIFKFERHREVTGSNRDRQNLIDLLYNEGCISLLHKRHIEQQPTQQLQNLEMLQLIKNGSIKTFKVALEYFRDTNQDEVFDIFNRKYLSEGDTGHWKISEFTLTSHNQILGIHLISYSPSFISSPVEPFLISYKVRDQIHQIVHDTAWSPVLCQNTTS